MLQLSEIHSGMSLKELEAEKQARDHMRETLADEMAAIHVLLEPKWAAETKATAGPPHLAQGVGFGSVKLGG